jgi:hypothetical protein
MLSWFSVHISFLQVHRVSRTPTSPSRLDSSYPPSTNLGNLGFTVRSGSYLDSTTAYHLFSAIVVVRSSLNFAVGLYKRSANLTKQSNHQMPKRATPLVRPDGRVSRGLKSKEGILSMLGVPNMAWKTLCNGTDANLIYLVFTSFDDRLLNPTVPANMWLKPGAIVDCILERWEAFWQSTK